MAGIGNAKTAYSQSDSTGGSTNLTYILKLNHQEAASDRGRSLIITTALIRFRVAVSVVGVRVGDEGKVSVE